MLMVADAASIYLATALLMLIATLGLIWAASQDQLRVGEHQAMVILDEDDLRYQREWETPLQAAERQARYGDPVPPRPGEWGGAR